MQTYNYHTHTYRCRHAKGNEKDYIDKAIENGFKHLGFSEHCAYADWENSPGRLMMNEMDEYFNSIGEAREIYKDKIKIYRGLEIEYFPDLKNYFLELKEKYDYIIVGEHSLDRKGRDIDIVCTDEDLKLYSKYICESIENKVTDYVAHIDYFMLGRDDFNDYCAGAVKEIATCAKENNVPVELNLKGAGYGIKEYKNYKSFIYPNNKTLEVLAQVNPEIVIGYDAHNPVVFEQRELEKVVRDLAENYGLKEPLKDYVIKKRV